MITPTDKFGREFKVGDYIVHAVDRDNLQLSKVLGFKESKEPDYYTKKHTVSVIVWGIQEWFHQKVELNKSKGFLTEHYRAMVIESSQVPEKYRKLLDPVTIETRYKDVSRKDDVGHKSVD